MSLGLPTSNNQNAAASGLASLFSTRTRAQSSQDVGVAGGVQSNTGRSHQGLDWASTLRNTAAQQHHQATRQRANSVTKDTSKATDRAADKVADRTADRAADRNQNRSAGPDKSSSNDVGRDDTRTQPRDLSRTNIKADDSANDSRDTTAAASDTQATDSRYVTTTQNGDDSSAQQDKVDVVATDDPITDDADTKTDTTAASSDQLTLQAAYAQALLATPAATQADGVAVESQQAVTDGKQASPGQAQAINLEAQQSPEGQSTPQDAAGSGAEKLVTGKAGPDGKALPAQVASASHANAQNQPGALQPGDGSTSQNQQHNPQHQNQSGQSGAGGNAASPTHNAAAAQAPSGPLPEIPAVVTGHAASGNNVAAGAGGQGQGAAAAPALNTLPAGADALLNGQGHDDADPNVTRIAQGLRSAVNLKGGAVTIRLNPNELGSVRIEMQIKNGNVSAQLQTEHASVRDLLNHQLGSLRQSLISRGLHVERLEVNAPMHSQDASAGRNAQESPNQGRSRGQFFQQQGSAGGDGRQGGSGSQNNSQTLAELKAFNEIVVDMVG